MLSFTQREAIVIRKHGCKIASLRDVDEDVCVGATQLLVSGTVPL